MGKSRSWSTASAPCRIELRASPVLAAVLAALGAAAAVATMLAELSPAASVLLAVTAVLEGLRLAGAELRRPAFILVLARGAVPCVDGRPTPDLRLEWRGPLVFIAFRGADGRKQRRIGWPDVLDRRARRELRLADASRDAAPIAGSMAP